MISKGCDYNYYLGCNPDLIGIAGLLNDCITGAHPQSVIGFDGL